ncbi:MAG: hypothetical protein IPM34_08005 [Saprospiraceae bacterium]|nr:hypothetical protein [Saprospiraceae bacterium]
MGILAKNVRAHRTAQPHTLAAFLPWGIQRELVVNSYAAKIIEFTGAMWFC